MDRNNDEQQHEDRPPVRKSGDETIIIRKGSPLRRKLSEIAASQDDRARFKQAVTLIIRDMSEHLVLDDDQPISVGRADLEGGFRPDVDLMPYGAKERGVSREHVRLQLRDRRLYIIDLGSANGTFVGNQRLTPEEPHELHDGDELLLGRLPVRVEFE